MALLPLMLQRLEMFYPFTSFLLFISAIFFFLKLKRACFQKPNLPPSPPKLPLIGNLHQLGTLLHRSLRDLSNKYGPLMFLHLGSRPTLVVSSAEMAKEITKTHDIAFANRPFTTAAKALLYGCTDIGFSPYGEYWRQMRKIVVVDLLSIKMVQSFKYIREQEVAMMIDEISRSSFDGAPVNLTKMFMDLSNNIIFRSAFGFKIKGKNKFGELSREFTKYLGASSFRDLFPWLGWMDVLTGLDRRMKKLSREVDTFLDQIIDEHITFIKDDDRKDFVDLLLHAQKDSLVHVNITRDNIKAVLLDMFVAGSDTSSTFIEWAMAELMKNPCEMKKVQEEVRRVVGKKNKVDEDDINQMDYLKAIIKETLRLHAPAPLLAPRETYTSINIKGYNIPPYTRVIINIWAIQRDPKFWDRAEEFIPERFINNKTIDYKGQDYEYIPFGSGRRGCPGLSFGLATVELAVSNLLYWFDWEVPGDENMGGLDMSEAFGLTVKKRTPLLLIPRSCFTVVLL